MNDIVMPDLPPEYRADIKDASNICIRHNSQDDLLTMMVARNGTLYVGAPSSKNWALVQQYPTAQEAIDAGVLRLWLGQFE